MTAKTKKKPAKAKKDAPLSVFRLRRPERVIFLWAFLAGLAGLLLFKTAGVSGKIQLQAEELYAVLGLGLMLLAAHLIFLIFRFRGDPILTGVVACLTAIGILAQQRMGVLEMSLHIHYQEYLFAIGMALMVLIALFFRKGRITMLSRFSGLAGCGAICILLAVLLLGQRYRGAFFAPGNMTPTEMIKVLTIWFVAGYLHKRIDPKQFGDDQRVLPPIHVIFPLALFWLCIVSLLLLQRDLGMIVILSLMVIFVFVVATGRWHYLIFAAGGASLFGWLAFKYFLHGQRRILAWADPFSDPTGAGWQVMQALSGMYAGGLFGAGFGQGNPERIPIAASDFIYAVIGEEMGFLGCVVVVALYLVLIFRGLQIARKAHTPFAVLLVSGLSLLIAIQTFVNIAGVTKFLPVTGITLPFISHGGSSLITSFVALGMILAVSEEDPTGKKSRKKKKAAKKPKKK